jgi:hypothetical protein
MTQPPAPRPTYVVAVLPQDTGEVMVTVTRQPDGAMAEIVLTENDFGGPVDV